MSYSGCHYPSVPIAVAGRMVILLQYHSFYPWQLNIVPVIPLLAVQTQPLRLCSSLREELAARARTAMRQPLPRQHRCLPWIREFRSVVLPGDRLPAPLDTVACSYSLHTFRKRHIGQRYLPDAWRSQTLIRLPQMRQKFFVSYNGPKISVVGKELESLLMFA